MDYFGHLVAWRSLRKVLRPGGTLYLSVPIGRQRIEFDAHRVFSVKYLLEMASGEFRVESFSYVDDEDRFFEDAELTETTMESSFGCDCGCGIFEFVKL